MPPKGDKTKVSEKPKSEKEAKEQLEQEKHVHERGNKISPEVSQEGEKVSSEAGKIEMATFSCSTLEAAHSSGIQPNASAADPSEPVTRMEELESRYQNVQKELAKAEKANKMYNLSRFSTTAAIISSITSVSALLYAAIKAAIADEKNEDVPEDVEKLVRGLVKAWKDQTDQAYWECLANYVSDKGTLFTIGDQILFMNYTIDLFPSDLFIWDSKQDAVAIVDQLMDGYNKRLRVEDMYRTIPSIKYKNEPIPRPIQAQLLRWALVEI